MAVGAFAAYNVMLRVPHVPVLASFAAAGLVTAAVGLLFGLPSLRIKGFYLAVTTLAAQFVIEWVLTRFAWFSNYNPSGVISAQKMVILGYRFESPLRRYLLTLESWWRSWPWPPRTWSAATSAGRGWRSGTWTSPPRSSGSRCFGPSSWRSPSASFYCGVAGALWAFAYLGSVEPQAFDLNRSFQILFMIIIGGMGSVLGSFLGAAFIVLLPILLSSRRTLSSRRGSARASPRTWS